MNIFYLDHNPDECARMHADKHVVKMILEYAQLLSTAHRVLDGEEKIELNARGARMRRWYHPDPDMDTNLYKSTHVNHPSAVWVRQSVLHYKWLTQLWLALMLEYKYRYGKHHATEKLIPYLLIEPKNIPQTLVFNQPTPAMDDEFIISDDNIINYRNYYNIAKQDLLVYTKRDKPYWVL